MKKLVYLFVLIIPFYIYGKEMPFSEIIETDSSTFEIIRNSVYRIYEETYKYKDSVWRSISYINDTTKLKTEGWQTKAGKHLGIWKEYTRKGELMYTWNHNTGTFDYNKQLFPFHEILINMKKVADSIIIAAYSKEFYENHVGFEGDCNARDNNGYVGNWTEPLIRKPTEFIFRYSIKLSDKDWYREMIGIQLDSNGNYVPSFDDRWNRYGFEEIKGEKRTFNIDKIKAMEIAKTKGLVVTDSSTISEYLFWDNFHKQKFYNGQFQYYITDLVSKTDYSKGQNRKGTIFRFIVYSFNPWTGEFIEKKKMKSINEAGKLGGFKTGLMIDTD